MLPAASSRSSPPLSDVSSGGAAPRAAIGRRRVVQGIIRRRVMITPGGNGRRAERGVVVGVAGRRAPRVASGDVLRKAVATASPARPARPANLGGPGGSQPTMRARPAEASPMPPSNKALCHSSNSSLCAVRLCCVPLLHAHHPGLARLVSSPRTATGPRRSRRASRRASWRASRAPWSSAAAFPGPAPRGVHCGAPRCLRATKYDPL